MVPGKGLAPWKTSPTPCRTARTGSDFKGVVPTRIRPPEGSSSRLSSLRRVLLPAPEAPTST